jgi:prolipoprotein diacylglyceryltransferase
MLLLVFVALRFAQRRPHPPGSIMLGYLGLYGAGRFVVEAFRGDSTRHMMEMTASQYVALGMVGTAITLALLLRATAWRRYYAVKAVAPEAMEQD